MILEYDITHIDYWEKDAMIVVDSKEYYFQFEDAPTIEEAFEFFKKDSKFYEVKE